MLQSLFVALMQAAAGAPEAPPQQTAPAAQEQTAAPEQTAEATEDTTAQRRRERRCRARAFTGSRLSSVLTCRSGGEGYQDQDTRDALHDMQRPAGTNIGG